MRRDERDRTYSTAATPASAASGPRDAERHTAGGSARQQHASLGPRHRSLRRNGPWRSVVTHVADQFLACGVLEHGFARIRCDTCAHEYLLAFSCKCRYFCPSCHAKRVAIWTQWLDTILLAPVPHRQVVRTIPKRLRAYCLYRRRLLGEIARVAARTVTAAMRTLTGERDLAVGIVACLQTHGSRANGHPHRHLLVTDGGFRPDGTFVSWPVHDTARLTEAFRRAVLRLFVRLELFDEDQAAGMRTWPHSGFPVHTAVWVSEDDRAFATRLARSCARNPVALERLTYDRAATTVQYRSDKSEGADGGHRDRGPARVAGPGAGPHPRQGARELTVLRLVRQPPPRHAPSGRGGRAGRGRDAAGDRPCATAGADRGHPPLGGIAPGELRGRPPRLPDAPRRNAHRRVHHAAVGHRPDPYLPSRPRRDGRPRGRRSPPSTRGLSRPAPLDLPRPTGRADPRSVSLPTCADVRRARPPHRGVRSVPAGAWACNPPQCPRVSLPFL